MLEELQEPVPEDEAAVAEWAADVFAEVNAALFAGRLPVADIEVDSSWHLRGGAGGAHPGSGRIVLDPSVHSSLRDLGSTLLHEMLHLEVGVADAPEEHGRVFISRCLELNEQLAGVAAVVEPGTSSPLPPCGLSCRLGEFDNAVDAALLEVAGAAPAVAAAFAEAGDALPEDALPGARSGCGLLLADLCAAGAAPAAAARVPALCAAAACRRALEAPCGYTSWQMRSRTLARHFPVRAGRDYQVFKDYAALWEV